MRHNISSSDTQGDTVTTSTSTAPAARAHFTPFLTLAEKLMYAEELHRSSLLPKGFNGNRANTFYAVEYGEATGLHPLAIMQGLTIIYNKPSANAGLIAALVRKAGHKLRVSYDKTTRSATCTITRADDPEPFTVVWDLGLALQAGLVDAVNSETGQVMARDKDNKPTPWEKYTRSVLKARALTECAREACQEALFGIMYTPEELGAAIDEHGNAVAVPETAGAGAAPAPVVSAFKAQDGADLAHAAETSASVSMVVECAEVAGQLGADITAPDTGLTEKLHLFLLRTATLKAHDADTALDIYRGAASAGLLDEVIPGMEGADTQTLREYITAAGLSLRASRRVPYPLAVKAAADAAAAAQAAEEVAEAAAEATSDQTPEGEPDAAPGSGHPDAEEIPGGDTDGDTDDGDYDGGRDPLSPESV